MDYEQHVADMTDEARSNFYQSLLDPRIGMEAENIHLYDNSDSIKKFSAADYMAFESTLENLGEHDFASLQREPEGTPKDVRFGSPVKREGEWMPGFTYDYGPQGEVETQPLQNLDSVAEQKRMIEELSEQAAPETTSFYQIALIPNLMLMDEEFDDVIDWSLNEDSLTELFRNPCLRYGNIEDSYGKPSLTMGGAGGLQISGVPRVTGNIQKSDTDDIISAFSKGKDDGPGIPAMNPVFYGLTEAGSIISGGQILQFHGRDETYKHRHERSEHISAEIGARKHGYQPRFTEVDEIEEIIRENSEELLEYTAPVPIEVVQPEDGGPPLHQRKGYEYDAEDEFSIVMVGEDIENRTHRDIVESEIVEGYIRMEDLNGNEHREPVRLDTRELENPREFLERNYLQAESMNKPNIRFRAGYGCFESRDQDNTPAWHPALGIHAAKLRNWESFQEAAAQEGFQNKDAEYLREQQRKHGLLGKLHPDTDMTILDFVGKYQDLFTDPINEDRTAEVTSRHIRDLLEGGQTEAEKAHRAYIENDFEDFMERARVR